MSRSIRIALGPLALDVDVDAWAEDYGVEPTPSAVRRDVLSYLSTTLHGVEGAEHWKVVIR